ncbi:MAG: sensor histidine kinase [Desulfuromonas sp.]|nr:MAG: sensor histidine kinase [Desulfuromonas sp.]
MNEFLNLLQQMSIFLIIAYLFSKSPAFKALAGEVLHFKHRVLLYCIFTGFAIFGIYIGLPAYDAFADSSPIGIVLAGLVGGPLLGLWVGATAGCYSLYLSGWSELGVISLVLAVLQGGMGGIVCNYYQQRGKSEQLFNPLVAMSVTCAGVGLHLALVLLLAGEDIVAIAVPSPLVLPTLLANSLGAGLFMLMMRDQKRMIDRVGVFFSARALRIAERSLGIFGRGFNVETAKELARIIYDETGVGAVGISDRERVLAFVGQGADHHLEGLAIASPQTRQAIDENRVIYADGVREKFQCALSDNCPLASALIVPLRVDNEVVGTIKLYEPQDRLFMNLNRTLGEGIAQLLSEQLLRYRYENQKTLLTKAELKLIQAQVNPHFLFNALNTIIAVVRSDSDQARNLLLHLSNYFRKNLKRSSDLATLEEELDHVNSYLVIQRARFGDKLVVDLDIDPDLLQAKVPTFTLQPIVENAVKHGISNMIGGGTVKISAHRNGKKMVVTIEDNAGFYCEKLSSDGLGMNIVDKRIKSYYGQPYGTEIECVPDTMTRVTLSFPLEKVVQP